MILMIDMIVIVNNCVIQFWPRSLFSCFTDEKYQITVIIMKIICTWINQDTIVTATVIAIFCLGLDRCSIVMKMKSTNNWYCDYYVYQICM